MKKAVLAVLGVAALAACQPTVPDSAAGVGFGDYETYLRQREAELRGQQATTSPPAPVLTAPLNGGAYGAASPATPPGGTYGTAGYGATPVTSAAGMAAQQGTAAQAAAPAQGTIGADTLAALRATAPAGETAAPAPMRSGMTQGVGAPLDAMAPDPAPTVMGNGGPNLAAYALSATNAPGQSVYNRGGFHLTSSAAACRKYVSPDLAQMAFLQKGGPKKDPLNLDPDGDGFACGWDPRPFQMARP